MLPNKTVNVAHFICTFRATPHNRSQFSCFDRTHNTINLMIRFFWSICLQVIAHAHTLKHQPGECNALKCELTKSSSVVQITNFVYRLDYRTQAFTPSSNAKNRNENENENGTQKKRNNINFMRTMNMRGTFFPSIFGQTIDFPFRM